MPTQSWVTGQHQYRSRSAGRHAHRRVNRGRGIGTTLMTRPGTHAFGLVVIGNGVSLLVVSLETLAQGVGVVIRSLNQRLASNIIGHGLLGRATWRGRYQRELAQMKQTRRGGGVL